MDSAGKSILKRLSIAERNTLDQAESSVLQFNIFRFHLLHLWNGHGSLLDRQPKNAAKGEFSEQQHEGGLEEARHKYLLNEHAK